MPRLQGLEAGIELGKATSQGVSDCALYSGAMLLHSLYSPFWYFRCRTGRQAGTDWRPSYVSKFQCHREGALYHAQQRLILFFFFFFSNIALASCFQWASLVAQMVKNPPAMQETWVWPLGWEDPLEEGMATHSSILAWRIPWTEEPGGPQSLESQRAGHTQE